MKKMITLILTLTSFCGSYINAELNNEEHIAIRLCINASNTLDFKMGNQALLFLDTSKELMCVSCIKRFSLFCFCDDQKALDIQKNFALEIVKEECYSNFDIISKAMAWYVLDQMNYIISDEILRQVKIESLSDHDKSYFFHAHTFIFITKNHYEKYKGNTEAAKNIEIEFENLKNNLFKKNEI